MVDCSRLFDNDLPDGSVSSQVYLKRLSCPMSPHRALLLLQVSKSPAFLELFRTNHIGEVIFVVFRTNYSTKKFLIMSGTAFW